MKINFETSGTYRSLENESIAYGKSFVGDVERNIQSAKRNNALDITHSDKVKDNLLYSGQGKTKEEVMQDAGCQNLEAQQDFMVVMSNSLDSESFNKLYEDGFDPSEYTPEEIVTVVDRIKAVMIQSGQIIEGYTDEMSQSVQEAFGDLGNLSLVIDIDKFTPSEKKYFVENELEPTLNNIYMTKYSVGAQKYSLLGSDGVINKFSEKEWSQLEESIKSIIDESGYEYTAELENAAKWIVEREIPFNKETLESYLELEKIEFPITRERIENAISIAIADGVDPKNANLNKEKTNWQTATEIYDEINSNSLDEVNSQDVKKMRILEETRLIMTIDANKKLLESGFAIDTSKLEDLVEKLKEQEEKIATRLFSKEEPEGAVEKLRLYDRTNEAITVIKKMPLELIPKISSEIDKDTISDIEEQAKISIQKLARGNERYETFFTEIRVDLGDKISKAFESAPSLLESLGLEVTTENLKAVRALGYNHMEVNEENLKDVKRASELLESVVNKMNPANVLKMIREDVNPLKNSLQELKEYFDKESDSFETSQKKYSEYLYNLEKNSAITEEEKNSFIGIFRLIRQVEKSDGAAIGSLVNQQRELSFENLLSSIRSRRAKRTDIRVDDNSDISIRRISGEAIDVQINSGFNKNPFKDEQKLIEEELQQIKEELKQEGTDSYQEYIRDVMISTIESSELSEQTLYDMLDSMGETATLGNLYALSDMWKNAPKMYERIKAVSTKENQEALEEEARQLVEDFDGEAPAARYEDFLLGMQSKLDSTLNNKENLTFEECNTMGLVYKQIGFAIKQARENHYHVPMELNNSITSVHITFKNIGSDEEKINASMDTIELGKLSIELKVQNDKVSGFIVHEKKEVTDIISRLVDTLTENILGLGYEVMGVYSGNNAGLNPEYISQLSEKETHHSSSELYSIAKTVIKSVASSLEETHPLET